jgi:hypothetical protein
LSLANHEHVELNEAGAGDRDSGAVEMVFDLSFDFFKCLSGRTFGVPVMVLAFLYATISLCG